MTGELFQIVVDGKGHHGTCWRISSFCTDVKGVMKSIKKETPLFYILDVVHIAAIFIWVTSFFTSHKCMFVHTLVLITDLQTQSGKQNIR